MEVAKSNFQKQSKKNIFGYSIFNIRIFHFFVILLIGISFFYSLSSYTLLKIEMYSANSSTLEVYWADEYQKPFTKDKLEKTATKKGRQSYWFLMKDYKKQSYLRIDPAGKRTSIKIYNIKLFSILHGFFDIDFSNAIISTKDIVNTKDIEGFWPSEVSALDIGWFWSSAPTSLFSDIRTLGDDSQIEIRPVRGRFFVIIVLFIVALTGFLLTKRYYLQTYCSRVSSAIQKESKRHLFKYLNVKAKTFFFAAALFFGMVFLGYLSSLTLLKIDMDSENSSELEVFWADEYQPFTGDQLKKTATQKGRQTYWFLFKDYKKYSYLRIDPARKRTSIKVYSIQLFSIQHGFFEIDFFNDIINTKDIEGLWPRSPNESSYSEIKTSGRVGADPQIEIRPIQAKSYIIPLVFLILAVGLLFPKKYYLHAYLLLFGAVLLYYCFNFNETQVSFRTYSERPSQINVFWRYQRKSFSSTKARTVKIEAGTHDYDIKIGNFSNIESLYFDEGKDWQRIRLDHLKLDAVGYKEFIPTKYEMVVEKKSASNELIIPLAMLLLVCVLVSCASYFSKNRRLFYFKIFPISVRVLFLLVLFLVINLAWQSDFNVHPDEHAHIECLEYFSDYWDFPKVGDSRSEDSYQKPWGLSRLDDLGVSYFLAGKFRNIIEIVFDNEMIGDRAFNVLLFFLFFILGKNKRHVLFLAPLLCSPQIWYLYSYANRGGFVLFVSLLLAWQLVNQYSSLNTYLKDNKSLSNWKDCLFPGILLGILSIEQTNYILFILFVFSMLLWRLLFFVDNKKTFIYKCLIFMLMGASIFAVRKGIDISINGVNKQAHRIAYAEEHAEAEFKPSIAESKDSYQGLRLKAKGVSFADMFGPEWDWHKMTFKSFSGFYGYYMEYSPKWYYYYVLLIYAIVLSVFFKHAVFQENWKYNLFSILSLTALSGGILMGILFSWLHDFQPQGRYVFPIIPIILVYCWVIVPRLNRFDRSIMITCFMALALLSLYSFNHVALNYLIS